MFRSNLLLSALIFTLAISGLGQNTQSLTTVQSMAQLGANHLLGPIRPEELASYAKSHPVMSRSSSAEPAAVTRGLARAKVYKFATADFPGAYLSVATDANKSTVVGYFSYSEKTGDLSAFTLRAGLYQSFTVPGATATFAEGINETGQIVGFYEDASRIFHGFIYSGGTFTTIDVPDSQETRIYGVNDAGQMVGTYADQQANTRGFLLSAGSFTLIDYPNALYTIPSGINNHGDIVGYWADSSNHGFLLTGGVLSSFDFPLAAETDGLSINDDGEIAGFYSETAFGPTHGYIYSRGTFSNVDVAGASYTFLNRIKNSGRVIGAFLDSALGEHGLTGR